MRKRGLSAEDQVSEVKAHWWKEFENILIFADEKNGEVVVERGEQSGNAFVQMLNVGMFQIGFVLNERGMVLQHGADDTHIHWSGSLWNNVLVGQERLKKVGMGHQHDVRVGKLGKILW